MNKKVNIEPQMGRWFIKRWMCVRSIKNSVELVWNLLVHIQIYKMKNELIVYL